MYEQKIAIDIGSGDVKWFYVDDEGKERYGKFPTAVAKEAITATSFQSDKNEGVISFNGKNFKVGEDAVFNAIPTCTAEFQETYNPLLAYKAFLEAGLDLGKPIKIKTGIPLHYWDRREQLAKSMNGIAANGKTLDTEVIDIFAQGQGAYINEGSPNGSVAVIDGGLNTLNFLFFNNGKPDRSNCFANDMGAKMMIEDIRNYVRKKYDTHITTLLAKSLFEQQTITILGKDHNISDLVDDLKTNYIEDLFMNLKAEKGELLKQADKVIFTGGLAYFLEGVKLEGNIVLSSKPYEYCNVRGYYYG